MMNTNKYDNTKNTFWTVSRRKQVLALAASIYVLCTLGLVQQNPSRWMQVEMSTRGSARNSNPYHVRRTAISPTSSYLEASLDSFTASNKKARAHFSSVVPTNFDIDHKESEPIFTETRREEKPRSTARTVITSPMPPKAREVPNQRAISNRNPSLYLKNEEQLEDGSWEDHPLFVMTLPGSGAHAASQYLQCGLGDDVDQVAMYWVPRPKTANMNGGDGYYEIGRCMQDNLQQQRPVLDNCGSDQQSTIAWSSIGYTSNVDQQCFFPSMNTTALEAIAREYPKATILQVTRDPADWYDDVSDRWRRAFASHCGASDSTNPNTVASHVPSTKANKEDWMHFYTWHKQQLRDFAQAHPTLRYIEVSLDDGRTGQALERQLGIQKSCWYAPKKRKPKKRSFKSKVPYPIFVASLPKSGTTSTQRYFQCGLGNFDGAAHHWTTNMTTGQDIKIGKCMQENMLRGRPLFEHCGNFHVWTDTGYMPDPNVKIIASDGSDCFFPTLQGGLEAFYKSYPNGTLMNVVRNATEWYESAMAWRKLPERMSRHCGGIGFPNATKVSTTSIGTEEQEMKRQQHRQDWINFYNWHTSHVRSFAQQHPSLTYIEVSLEAPETAQILHEKTGIDEACWGNCSPDRRKAHCGVLQHLQRQMRGEDGEHKDSIDGEFVDSNSNDANIRWRTVSSTLKRNRQDPNQKHKKLREMIIDDRRNYKNREKRKWAKIQKRFNHLKDTPIETNPISKIFS